MSMETYEHVRHQLSPLERSVQHLQMANGNVVIPLGCWKGTVELGSATVEGSFEVFDSSGSWSFLFGKRLMTTFAAVHDYAVDEVFIPQRQLILKNQYNLTTRMLSNTYHGKKMCKEEEGDTVQSPVRGVLPDCNPRESYDVDTHISAAITQQTNDEQGERQAVSEEEQGAPVGDKEASSWREVPIGNSTNLEAIADEQTSHRASMEEVEDDDSPRCKENKTKERAVETETKQLEQQRWTDDNKQKCQEKLAGDGARRIWKAWKGHSQCRHHRWKTRNENVARVKRKHSEGGMAAPPAREVLNHSTYTGVEPANIINEVSKEQTTTPICIISGDEPETGMGHAAEIPTEELASDNANIFTCAMDPFKPARVKERQRLVTIRDDLTAHEHAQVQLLISEFTDVFALSVSEVKQVDGTIHWLNIEPNAKFSTKVHQKPLTPSQRRYLHKKLQAMLDAALVATTTYHKRQASACTVIYLQPSKRMK